MLIVRFSKGFLLRISVAHDARRMTSINKSTVFLKNHQAAFRLYLHTNITQGRTTIHRQFVI